jgi:hypothetical protein
MIAGDPAAPAAAAQAGHITRSGGTGQLAAPRRRSGGCAAWA